MSRKHPYGLEATMHVSSNNKWLIPSALVGGTVAVAWLNAPSVPAVAGALGAGLLLYWRARRAAQ